MDLWILKRLDGENVVGAEDKGVRSREEGADELAYVSTNGMYQKVI